MPTKRQKAVSRVNRTLCRSVIRSALPRRDRLPALITLSKKRTRKSLIWNPKDPAQNLRNPAQNPPLNLPRQV
jgi:hypothetical protein